MAVKLTQEEFIRRAQAVNPYYDYSLAVYEQSHKKVKIICPSCGVFEISPSNLFRGGHCTKCSGNKLITRTFIDKMMNIFPEYMYGLVNYVNNKTKVTVICRSCGSFESRADNLLKGHGCPSCADTGFNPAKNAVLYVHEITNGTHTFTGFGITRNIVSRTRNHVLNLKRVGYSIEDTFVTDEFIGSSIQDLETTLMCQFPIDVNTSSILGFKTESTTAPYKDVVAFCTNYIEENYGSY